MQAWLVCLRRDNQPADWIASAQGELDESIAVMKRGTEGSKDNVLTRSHS